MGYPSCFTLWTIIKKDAPNRVKDVFNVFARTLNKNECHFNVKDIKKCHYGIGNFRMSLFKCLYFKISLNNLPVHIWEYKIAIFYCVSSRQKPFLSYEYKHKISFFDIALLLVLNKLAHTFRTLSLCFKKSTYWFLHDEKIGR